MMQSSFFCPFIFGKFNSRMMSLQYFRDFFLAETKKKGITGA